MIWGKLRILRELFSDLFDDLLRLVEISVAGHTDGHLVDNPVAAQVLNRTRLPIGHGEYGTAVMPQF